MGVWAAFNYPTEHKPRVKLPSSSTTTALPVSTQHVYDSRSWTWQNRADWRACQECAGRGPNCVARARTIYPHLADRQASERHRGPESDAWGGYRRYISPDRCLWLEAHRPK